MLATQFSMSYFWDTNTLSTLYLKPVMVVVVLLCVNGKGPVLGRSYTRVYSFMPGRRCPPAENVWWFYLNFLSQKCVQQTYCAKNAISDLFSILLLDLLCSLTSAGGYGWLGTRLARVRGGADHTSNPGFPEFCLIALGKNIRRYNPLEKSRIKPGFKA